MSPPWRGSSTGLKGCRRQQFPAQNAEWNEKCPVRDILIDWHRTPGPIRTRGARSWNRPCLPQALSDRPKRPLVGNGVMGDELIKRCVKWKQCLSYHSLRTRPKPDQSSTKLCPENCKQGCNICPRQVDASNVVRWEASPIQLACTLGEFGWSLRVI